MFKFNKEFLDEENPLGEGNHGEVLPYKDPQDPPETWVIKRILIKNIQQLFDCLSEIVLGFSCNHPCIVPVKGYAFGRLSETNFPCYVYLKIPRMKETLKSNFDKKRNSEVYSTGEIIHHFYCLASGVEYLHSRDIYHRDIKPDNLLLEEGGNLKIADIGISQFVEEKDLQKTLTKQQAGTYHYGAPEMYWGKASKDMLEKADIWSIGIVILELCISEKTSLNTSLPRKEFETALNESLVKLEEKHQKHPLVALVKRLLSLNPGERPNAQQIKDELEKMFSEIPDQGSFNLRAALDEYQLNEVQTFLKQNKVRDDFKEEVKSGKQKLDAKEDKLNRQKQGLEAKDKKQKSGKQNYFIIIAILILGFCLGLGIPPFLGKSIEIQEKEEALSRSEKQNVNLQEEIRSLKQSCLSLI